MSGKKKQTNTQGSAEHVGIDNRNTSDERYRDTGKDNTLTQRVGGREAEVQEKHPELSHKDEQNKHLNHERAPAEPAFSGGNPPIEYPEKGAPR